MKRYLLIDDDEIFNFLNRKVLEKSGQASEIMVCSSAKEGLQYIAEIISNRDLWPQVILLDIRMPGMDGFEFLRILKDQNEHFLKQVKVFMLTSSIDDRDKQKSEMYPFVYGYFSKPLNPSILIHIDSISLKNYDTI